MQHRPAVSRALRPARKLLRDRRGAGLLEYVFLIVAVLLLAALAFKQLGPKIGAAANKGAAAI